MKTTIFNINYKKIEKNNFLTKETSLFLINNFLRIKFIIENKKPEIFHKYDYQINNSINKLTDHYYCAKKIKTKDVKSIINLHKILEKEIEKLNFNEKKFNEWLKNQKNI